jgi:uncharacterized protein (DUF2235 family)
MTNLSIAKSSTETLISTLPTFMSFTILALLSNCGTLSHANKDTYEPSIIIRPLAGDPNSQKSIFVFLDGTMNNTNSGTNVWRTYDLLAKNDDPQMTSIYIEGVGSLDNPLFGTALGRGMEERILRGYEFIAQNYKPGDDIYIFGFSRGAHEARALAGLLAYAGVPIISGGDRNHLITIGNKVLELTKDKSDKDYLGKWTSWKPGQSPLLAAEIKNELGLEMRTAEVKFLGVWDTVPGSSFKKYKDCKEKIGFWKRWFYWLPVINKGERYKTDSYPAIHQIAHAVSLDEKRSKFAPLLLCPAINPKYTKLSEVWFPGAHADVGGGYDDSDELPGISLNWMLRLLSESYKFNTTPPQVKESATGLAHWSVGDFPANMGSECLDRRPPQGAQFHPSFEKRKNSSPVLIRIKGVRKSLPYPIDCSTQAS